MAALLAVDDRLADEITAYRTRVNWQPLGPEDKHPRLHFQIDDPAYVMFAIKDIVFGGTDREGRSAIPAFLRDESAKLDPVAIALLEAQTRARVAVWRLDRVLVGLELTDARSGERRLLYEPGLSKVFVGREGGAVLARVVELDGLVFASGLHLNALSRAWVDDVVAAGETTRPPCT